MAAKRKTKKVIQNVTADQAEEASRAFAEAQTQLEKIEAKMNEELNAVKAKYQADITDLKDSMDEPFEVLEVYAEEQKEKWGKKKSTDLLHCTIGFRTGQPKVAKEKGFSWDAIADLMNSDPMGIPFVRKTIEVDKAAILAEDDEVKLGELRTRFRVFVEQEETFYATVKKEEVALQ